MRKNTFHSDTSTINNKYDAGDAHRNGRSGILLSIFGLSRHRLWVYAKLHACIFVGALMAGCASPVMKPQMSDRLTGLVSPSQLKPGPSRIDNSKEQIVAVVHSENVKKSTDISESMMSMLTGVSQLYHLDFESGDDAKIILSSERLLDALKAPLKQRFRDVVEVKSLAEGFSKGADYVAILDLELGYEYHEDPTYKWMNFTHTANASYLFISKSHQQGPELISLVTHEQKTPAAGASANNSDFLVNVKEARTKMLRQMYGEFNVKVRN